MAKGEKGSVKKRARTTSKSKEEESLEDETQTTSNVFVSDDPSVLAVYAFLADQNRPFSVQNIIDGLASKTGLKKGAVERALAELVEKQHATCKEYGKSKIYITKQANISLPSDEEMKALDAQLGERTNELDEVSAKCQHFQGELQRLVAEPRTADAQSRVQQLQTEIIDAKARCAKWEQRAGGYDESKRRLILKNHQAALRAWKRRKHLVKSIVQQMADGMERRPSDLSIEMGIEEDKENEDSTVAGEASHGRMDTESKHVACAHT